MGSVMSVFAAPTLTTTRSGRAYARLAGGGSESVVEATATAGHSQTGGVAPASGKQTEKTATEKATEKADSDDEFWGDGPDGCGLEDWGPDVRVRKWEGPQRIKECTLTAAEQAKYRSILETIFDPDTIMGVKVIFQPDDMMEVLTKVIEYLKTEPVLIEDVPFGVSIVGDIHGQLYDLDRVFKGDAKDGKPGWECAKYVFLGDMVDRGRQAIEVMMALYILKMLYPDRIFLLRGNHEFPAINHSYGFQTDFKERYDEPIANLLWNMSNETFQWLSIAAIVGNIYYCSHGGISPTGFTRRQMRGLYKPFHNANEDIIIQDATWSDPAQGLKGSAFNKDRGSSIYFGFDELCHALASLEVVAIFRGHTLINNGYENSWNVCYTIFTATAYQDGKNVGAVAVVDDKGKVGFRILEVCEDRVAFERMIYELEYEKEKEVEVEEKTVAVDAIGDGGPGHIQRFGRT